MLVAGPGIVSGGWSDCTVVGSLGTYNSTSHGTNIVLAGDDEQLPCGCEAVEPVGGVVVLAGSRVVVRVSWASEVEKYQH